jgi:predicted murein hydrolase (TIGR00659 family)
MVAGISFIITIFSYFGAKFLYGLRKSVFLCPLLICPLALISLLLSFHVSYDVYYSGTQWITDMLQPATVAFVVPLYKYHRLLRKYALEIVVGGAGGSFIAILSSVEYGKWLNLTPQVLDSMAPRSVTTPIAMDVSQTIGGVPTMTAVFVILTGIMGLIVGPFILKWLPIKNEVSKGMLLGMGAHGAGASKAYEIGSVEGAIASLTMIIAGFVTIMIAPLLVPVIVSF